MPSDLNETLYGDRSPNPRPLCGLDIFDVRGGEPLLVARRRPDGVWEVVLELEE